MRLEKVVGVRNALRVQSRGPPHLEPGELDRAVVGSDRIDLHRIDLHKISVTAMDTRDTSRSS